MNTKAASQPAQSLDQSGIDPATKAKIIAADLANIVKKVKSGRPLSPTERKLIQESEHTPLPTPARAQSKPKAAAELAAILGISKQNLNEYKRKPDAPPLSDLAAWQVYLAAHGRDGAAPAHIKIKMAEKRLSLLTTADSREKIKLGRDNDSVIDKSEVQTALQSGMAMMFSQLESAFCNSLPPSLAGKTPPAIAERCQIEIEKIISAFKERLGAMAQSGDTKK